MQRSPFAIRRIAFRCCTAVVERIEMEAQAEGVERLCTEASQLSRPLLERRGWRVVAPEIIAIAGVPFERYRMDKPLRQS